MSEFEPCPVTGKRPVWGFGKLVYHCPLVNSTRNLYLGREQCLNWWHDTYLPAARKYAELMQGETVEFQVGDVVGLAQSGFLHHLELGDCCFSGNLQAEVVDVHDHNVRIKPGFLRGVDLTQYDKKYLRLIRRPRKLTVADLPEGCPITVEHNRYADLWRVLVNGINVKSWQTEHDAVTDALSTFIDPITDARNKQREAAE